MELWHHQEQALTALRQTVAQGVKRIVLAAPTGSGKTRLAAAVVEGALRKGNRVAFVVPLITLVDQTVEQFYEQEIRNVGVIQANHEMTDWARPIQVCSIQTIRSKKAYPQADVVIFDECHVLHAQHKEWLSDEKWQKIPFIGLSATPWTKGLGKYFETLLTVATTQELIDKGLLSKFRIFATGHPDLSGVKITHGDYQEDQLSHAMQQGTLTADIIATWKKHCNGGKTLCFAVDCAHAKTLQERFIEAGIACGYQDANTPKLEREEIKRKFHNGEYRVVTNIATLTMGADWDCRCLILARPTRSRMLYVQIIGRSLRTASGKEFAVILDHSDSTQRLGFVTDIVQEHLDGGKEPAKEARRPVLPKECKSCGMLKPIGARKCPNCGFEPAKTISERYEGDGELVEITKGMLRKGKKTQNREWTMAEKTVFLAELKGFARDHGYKDGWAAHKYRTRFDVWPDWSIKDVQPATYVSTATRSWIRSQLIAWAKSKKDNAQANV